MERIEVIKRINLTETEKCILKTATKIISELRSEFDDNTILDDYENGDFVIDLVEACNEFIGYCY